MRTPLAKPSRYNHYVELAGQSFLVFNALSGVLALVDGRSAREHLGLEQTSNLKVANVRLESGDAEPATVEDLLAAGFLVHTEVDELEVYRYRWYAAQLDPSVVSLTICPTMRCNMDCVYCFEDRDGADMTSEMADALVSWVQRRLERARTLNVLWFGGEPLLRPDFIEELSVRLVEAAKQAGAEYYAGIFTNGYCLGRRELETLERSLIREVVIPLDGPEEVHERRRRHLDGRPVFAQILENGARASELLDVTFQCTIDRDNEQAAWQLYDFLAENGYLERASFRPVRVFCDLLMQTRRPDGAYDSGDFDLRLIAAYRQRIGRPKITPPCPAPYYGCTYQGHYCYAVDAHGLLYKCVKAVGRREHAVGHIAEPPGLDSPALAPWLKIDPFRRPGCRDCNLLPVCGGGCAMAYIERGHPLCTHLRTTLRDWLVLCAEAEARLGC